ncbi:hypothetical protein GOV06_05300 [Candidatus Woesearchaeota archaeon]|nr:hypothetical protein [Candidatus Woesearchaeota archaeon]
MAKRYVGKKRENIADVFIEGISGEKGRLEEIAKQGVKDSGDVADMLTKENQYGIKIYPKDINVFLKTHGYEGGWRIYFENIQAEYDKKHKLTKNPKSLKLYKHSSPRKYGACLDRTLKLTRRKGKHFPK